MKANLVQREPEFQKRWAAMDLRERIRSTPHPKGRFVLHDGPPYANGDIHLGHLLNKTLKDLVVRSRTMMGYDVDFVPGWDCHGLPIEYRVLQELGDEATGMPPLQVRRRCERYAAKHVKRQSQQLQRLGTLGNYADPYLSMSPDYEAPVLEVFADLVAAGLVFRAKKPVHWSISNQTALAEAELEYFDREDPSLYALFDVLDAGRLPPSLGATSVDVQLMIWTSTPWTLPANLAVALSAGARYALYRFERAGTTTHSHVILAEALGQRVLETGGARRIEKLGVSSGRELAEAGIQYSHPLLADGRCRRLVAADYVTLDEGTGLVHTAPGHGADDYATGLREGLEILCPVEADGRFDETAPVWLQGVSVWDANPLVIERLRESGHLFHTHPFTHSYPHDWRSKTAVIFRATEQWFVGVDRAVDALGGATLRELALRAVAEKIDFVPAWGRNRLRGMLETRPDWCLSRQRAWGLPIPAFYGPDAGQVLLTPASIRAVAEVVRGAGSNRWFTATPEELLAGYDPHSDFDAPDWIRESPVGEQGLVPSHDIFDVWFESGSSWHAVLRERELGYPADLYLEGSDQHRGWFQSSLLAALGTGGRPPFKALLTHGFVVDANGLKMSKSGDNALSVEDLLRQYGADVCRWWVSSLSYGGDVKADAAFFASAADEYRKVRNTLRFLLANLADFDAPHDRRELAVGDACALDAWAGARLAQLAKTVEAAYERYEFREATRALYHFCNDTLSAVYLAAVKDRLYCDVADSDRRRRCQTLLWDAADTLCRLLAPILVHTAEETQLTLHGRDMQSPCSIHTEKFRQPPRAQVDPRWDAVMRHREAALKALEDERSAGVIENPLDAGILLRLPEAEALRLTDFAPELADLCGVSQFRLSAAEPAGLPAIEVVDLRAEPRCERSWKRDGSVVQRSDGGWLSERDWLAVSARAAREVP